MSINEKSPDAATPEEIVEVPIEDYGRGSYTQREIVDRLLEIDPKLKSVNLLLE